MYNKFHNKSHLLHYYEITNQFDFESLLTAKLMTYFRHRHPPVHILRKPTYKAQKIVDENSDFTSFLIYFFFIMWSG